MNFNRHSNLEGQHAFLGASKYHWINYTDDKIADSYVRFLATQKGTVLHAFAAQCILLGQKLPKSQKTLNMYVNDAIGYVRQMDNFTIFGSNKRKLRKLLEDIKKWLAEIGMKIKGNWQIFRVGFTPKVERAHQALPKKKQRHRRPRLPSALGYRFGHGYTILRKHNLFRLKQSLHLYYYRRDRNRVISFKRASGLISRLGQLRKCNHQQVLDRYYQPKTMFALKKVVRKECRRLQALYPPYQAA